MDKIKIYVRVEGESKRHVFVVPREITLKAILVRFGDKLGIPKDRIGDVRAAVFTPLGEPLGNFEIGEGSEILIMTDPYKDEISYEGAQ